MPKNVEENINGTQDTSGEQTPAAPEGREDIVQCEAEQSALEGKVAELESRIKTLEVENVSLKDQLLRKQADFENFRKRINRDKLDSIQFGNKQLLLDLVPVLDDFERAVKSGEESRDFTAFHDGIVLIEKQFAGLLERKWGLQRFDSVGEDFDPQKHEAITSEERKDHETSIVLEDYQKGYFLHDKVLRAAKVKVSLPVPGENGNTKAES